MTLTPDLVQQLSKIRTIDLTTYGKKTSLPRRIEIWWFHVDNRFVITGTPGRRDWLANVRVNPQVIVHASGHDLDGLAVEIADEEFRRQVFTEPHTRWYRTQSEFESLVATAPMIEVTF